MTVTYEFDPDISTMYLHTKNEVSKSRLSKVIDIHRQRQADKQTRPNALPAAFAGRSMSMSFIVNQKN